MQVVLFFDKLEVLWRDATGGAFVDDGWIRRLYKLVSSLGVLLVLFGRDKLLWAENFPAGNPVQKALVGLSPADARALLQKSNSKIPTELIDSILRITCETRNESDPKTHHCYLLQLCAEIVRNTINHTGLFPEPPDFDGIDRLHVVDELAARF